MPYMYDRFLVHINSDLRVLSDLVAAAAQSLKYGSGVRQAQNPVTKTRPNLVSEVNFIKKENK